MKKAILILSISFLFRFLSAQPAAFIWASRHGYTGSYISPAKDQKEQKPCGIFSAVAAVEAIAQIYFNKYDPNLDLSESNLYNQDCGLGCMEGLGAYAALEVFMDPEQGIVDDITLPYPSYPADYCRDECGNIYTTFRSLVTIPLYDDISLNDSSDLQKAIMDYGPIIMASHVDVGTKIGCTLHPVPDCTYNHTVLVIGWFL